MTNIQEKTHRDNPIDRRIRRLLIGKDLFLSGGNRSEIQRTPAESVRSFLIELGYQIPQRFLRCLSAIVSRCKPRNSQKIDMLDESRVLVGQWLDRQRRPMFVWKAPTTAGTAGFHPLDYSTEERLIEEITATAGRLAEDVNQLSTAAEQLST